MASESEDQLAESLAALDEVRSAVVWRLGGVPVTAHAGENLASLDGRMLSALVGGFEKGVEDLGFGEVSQIWWQSSDVQCVGFRAGKWQVLVIADPGVSVSTLRTGVAETVEEFWGETDSTDGNGVD